MRGFTESGSWDLIGSMGMSFNLFGHAPGGHLSAGQPGTGRAGGRGAAGAPHAMDVNRTRILLLHLAEFLGLLPPTLTGRTATDTATTTTAVTPPTLRELLLSGWTVDLLLQYVRDIRVPVRRSDFIDAAIAIGEVHGHMAARALCDRLLAQEALVLVPAAATDVHRSSSSSKDKDLTGTSSSTAPRHVADLIHTRQQQQPQSESRSQRARLDVKAALDTDNVGAVMKMSRMGGDYFADSIDDSDCDVASDEDDDEEEEHHEEEGVGWKTEPGFPINASGGAGRATRSGREVMRQSDDATSSSRQPLPMNNASYKSSSSTAQIEVQPAAVSPTQPMYLLQAPSLLAADEQGPGLAQAPLPGTAGGLGVGGVGKMHRRTEPSSGGSAGTVRGFTVFLPNTSHQFKSPPPQHPQYIQQLHESRERKKKSSSSSLPSLSSSTSLRDYGPTSGEAVPLHEEIGPGPWLRAWIRSCRQSIEQAWVGAETGRGVGADDTSSYAKGNSSSSGSSFVVNGRVSINTPTAAAATSIGDAGHQVPLPIDNEGVLKLAPAPAVTMQSFKVGKPKRTLSYQHMTHPIIPSQPLIPFLPSAVMQTSLITSITLHHSFYHQVKVQLRTRADGPTKVLELLEVIEEDEDAVEDLEGLKEGVQGTMGDKAGASAGLANPNNTATATAVNAGPSGTNRRTHPTLLTTT